MTASPPNTLGGRLSGAVALVIIVVLAAIVFLAVWLAFPNDGHFVGLLAIGVLALVLALLTYFLQAAASDPNPVRAAGWGLFGMGGAILLLTILLDAPASVSTGSKLAGVFVVLVALAIGFLGAAWRGRTRATETNRQQSQASWRQKPVTSAFSYSSANPPAVAPPPPPPGTPPPGASGGA
ncbi:MAG: hypothetical protein L3K07_01935 [Thermoplasmata archaeon]|nr:hypothetical protein [Thermoplasmata archaeon]